MGRSVLAGDIGGTKTTLALYAAEDARVPERIQSYDSRAARDLDSLIARFLAVGAASPPTALCLAVAGPVIGQSVRVTNLPWEISAPALASRFCVRDVRLLNDVEALAYAIPALRANEIDVLHAGDADPDGTIGILALGTGLGEACLIRHDGLARAHSSEGGHADFAPVTPRQARLLESLWHEHSHVSVERVCSGIGLPKLYRFLVDEEGLAEGSSVAAEIAAASDSTPVIVQAALSGRSVPCREAVALLCDILAAEAGNFALKILATGGIFLGGGMPPRLLPFLRAPGFRKTFAAKGRFSSLLERVPVAAVLAPQAVLWGAALCGLSLGQSKSDG